MDCVLTGTACLYLPALPPVFESDKTAIRCFPVIFWQAQKQLRKIFAMELVPLRQRGKENEALARQKEELQATQAGTAPTQQRAEASPGAYLPVRFITSTVPAATCARARSCVHIRAYARLDACSKCWLYWTGLTGY